MLGGLLSAHILAASQLSSSSSKPTESTVRKTTFNPVSSSSLPEEKLSGVTSHKQQKMDPSKDSTTSSLQGADKKTRYSNYSSTSSADNLRQQHTKPPVHSGGFGDSNLSSNSRSTRKPSSSEKVSASPNTARDQSPWLSDVDEESTSLKDSNEQNSESISSSAGETVVADYDNELYDLALDLAARLLPAFQNSKNGLPHPRVRIMIVATHPAASGLRRNILRHNMNRFCRCFTIITHIRLQ